MIQQTLTSPNGSFTRYARVQPRRVSQRVITKVKAEDSADPKLDFTSNKRAVRFLLYEFNGARGRNSLVDERNSVEQVPRFFHEHQCFVATNHSVS